MNGNSEQHLRSRAFLPLNTNNKNNNTSIAEVSSWCTSNITQLLTIRKVNESRHPPSTRIISFSSTLWFISSLSVPRPHSIPLTLWHWCEVRIICRLSHVLLQERPLIEHRVQFHSIEFILEYREWVVSLKSETSLCNGVESTSHVLGEWWFTWISIRVLAPTISWIEIKISSERQTSECEFSSDPLVKCCRAAFLPLWSSFNVRALLNTYGAAMLVSGGVATANSAKGVTGNRVV